MNLFSSIPKVIYSTNLIIETLTDKHIAPLAQELIHPDCFFVKVRGFNTTEIVCDMFEKRLVRQENNLGVTFVFRDKKSDKLAGTTSVYEADDKFARAEMGFTWIAHPFLRTYVNREAKMSIMHELFKFPTFKRLQFTVDPTNETSKTAMLNLGATYEGYMRCYRSTAEGDPGHRNLFSITHEEFPALFRSYCEKYPAYKIMGTEFYSSPINLKP
jgi:RimJ/RimL family protein N-acetyltransferase